MCVFVSQHIIGGFSEGASKAVKDKAVEQMKLELLQVNLIALIKREKKKKIEGKTD